MPESKENIGTMIYIPKQLPILAADEDGWHLVPHAHGTIEDWIKSGVCLNGSIVAVIKPHEDVVAKFKEKNEWSTYIPGFSMLYPPSKVSDEEALLKTVMNNATINYEGKEYYVVVVSPQNACDLLNANYLRKLDS